MEQQRKLKDAERLFDHGTSGMGGQMNEEGQRFKTFAHWPHTETSHPGVTPKILASGESTRAKGHKNFDTAAWTSHPTPRERCPSGFRLPCHPL